MMATLPSGQLMGTPSKEMAACGAMTAAAAAAPLRPAPAASSSGPPPHLRTTSTRRVASGRIASALPLVRLALGFDLDRGASRLLLAILDELSKRCGGGGRRS